VATEKFLLVLRKREPENYAAVNQRDNMQTAPAKNTASAPINLVAKDVRNRYPEQAGDEQQVSKHRHEQAARFVAQKSRIKQRFGGEQTENPESAYRNEFIHEKQREHITDWQSNQERTTEAGKFTHLDGGDQPEGPSQANGEQHNSGEARARKLLYGLREARFYQPEQTDYYEKRAGDYSYCVQRKMVNHASNYTDGV
jgi:hypothetical protein